MTRPPERSGLKPLHAQVAIPSALGGSMIKMKQKVRFTCSNAGRRRIVDEPAAAPTPAGRVPRVAKLMAPVIWFDGFLRDDVVSDQSELARLAKVTQPRMTHK